MSGSSSGAGDLSQATRDLSSGLYSSQVPDDSEMLRVIGTERASYTGQLDGEAAQIQIIPHRFPWAQAPWVNVSAIMNSTNIFMQVIDRSPSLDEFHKRLRPILSTEPNFGKYYATERDLRAVFHAASGQPVAYVGVIQVRYPEWSELPVRLIHATIAYLAKMGAISGACLVVLDKRSYMYNRENAPLTLERGLRASRYNFEPIGSHLMVARAHDIMLTDAREYRHVRDAQIGVRSKGNTSRFGSVLGPHDEMLAKYTSFSVRVPNYGNSYQTHYFSRREGDEADYEELRQEQGAELDRVHIAAEAGALARATRNLASGKYNIQRPSELPQIREVVYTAELDGEMLHVTIGAGAAPSSIDVHTLGGDMFPEMSLSVVAESHHPSVFRGRFRRLMLDSGQLARYPASESDMDALYAAASNRQVVYVEDINVRGTVWSEHPLRLMHALIALLAKFGVISGSSLVVIDRRSYGYEGQKLPRALEEGVRASRYNFDPIGRSGNLMVARADYMRPSHADDYRLTRDAQIGRRRSSV